VHTVLCLEDDRDLLRDLVEELEDAGFRVLAGENGREGLELLAENHVDVIITDVMMPEVDGLEFLQVSRENRTNIPVFVISAGYSVGPLAGSATASLFRLLEDLGVRAVLQKPVDLQKLAAAAAEAIET